jgi:hypothetical protein
MSYIKQEWVSAHLMEAGGIGRDMVHGEEAVKAVAAFVKQEHSTANPANEVRGRRREDLWQGLNFALRYAGSSASRTEGPFRVLVEV